MINKYIKLLAVVFILLIAGSLMFVFYNRPQKTSSNDIANADNLQVISNNMLLNNENHLPDYKSFLNDLDKICPYYQSSGAIYRDCLANLLGQREKEDDQIVQDLQKSINLAIAKHPGSTQSEQDFLAQLANLQKTWKPYRDALCKAELAIAWGGSNQSGLITTCQLYQTEIYRQRLTNLKSSWFSV